MGLLNWTHLISQVECMVLDSAVTPEEFKEILSEDKWYKHEAWSTQKWWFERSKDEVTFNGLRAIWEWMGLDVDVLMGAMQYKLAEMVDELIANEHIEETLEMVKEEAA